MVMELVEGENLHGSLPLHTAVQYARQIADALEPITLVQNCRRDGCAHDRASGGAKT